MPERRVVLIGRVDFLVRVSPGNRRAAWIWFDLTDVPQLCDGEERWYEIERIRGTRPRGRKWRVVGPAPFPIAPGRSS